MFRLGNLFDFIWRETKKNITTGIRKSNEWKKIVNNPPRIKKLSALSRSPLNPIHEIAIDSKTRKTK
jgi:hypothetical protein